jgi:hypothetical protein
MSSEFVLWVAGGRDYEDKLAVRGALRPWAQPGNVLITGAARGADLLAERIWRDEFELPYIGVPAQWTRQGRAAGPIRNGIIAEGFLGLRPDQLLAFPGGNGTKNAWEQAEIHQIQSARASQ